jgi:hypothetical protein
MNADHQELVAIDNLIRACCVSQQRTQAMALRQDAQSCQFKNFRNYSGAEADWITGEGSFDPKKEDGNH